MLTSNVNILDTTSDSVATKSNGGASCANLGTLVVNGLDAAATSMLDTLVGDIADGECNR